MEKEKRRRCVRRQQKIEVPVNRRKESNRRINDRRSGFDRRIQQFEVSVEKRYVKERRAVK